MICNNCGYTLTKETMKFCPDCGEPVTPIYAPGPRVLENRADILYVHNFNADFTVSFNARGIVQVTIDGDPALKEKVALIKAGLSLQLDGQMLSANAQKLTIKLSLPYDSELNLATTVYGTLTFLEKTKRMKLFDESHAAVS